MAKGRSPRVSGGAAAQPSERDRIIDAAFSLIARQGWRRLSLAAIAASERRRQPCCAIRLSAASMIRSRSLGWAAAPPETRGERPFAITGPG